MQDNTANSRREVSGPKGGVYIMRIATVMLAVVSWWATAQGMRSYVFSEQWQANLASLAIQSILLGLNFYWPKFWKELTKTTKKWGLVLLSATVLFCSSWFSYVFIVDRVYEQAWDTDRQLLVQKIYREELYSSSDYSDTYEKALREQLSDQVIRLYSNAKDLEEDGKDVQGTQGQDFEEDRNKYIGDSVDFAASTEMQEAIDAMETAIKEEATANDREQSMNTLKRLYELVFQKITTLQEERIPDAQEATKRAKDNMDDLQDQIDMVGKNGEDTEDLKNRLSNASEDYSKAYDNEKTLRDELTDYQEAYSKISGYQTYLGLASETTGLQIGAALRSIQTALLQRDLNDEELTDLETQAVGIFQLLLSSENSMSDDASGDQTLLVDMERFIHAIQEYVAVCDIGDQLDSLILDLRNTGEVTENWKEEWKERLNNLKAQIGSLPADEQLSSTFLSQYEKTDSMFRLDDAIRLYISEHNAADQAIIYIMSPYRGLAIFSLILAFFLDIAAFVTGLLIDVIEGRKQEQFS